jgi:hypothetical protein
MAKIEKRTISLPGEQAAFIDAKVASGDYASVSEVVPGGDTRAQGTGRSCRALGYAPTWRPHTMRWRMILAVDCRRLRSPSI